MVSLPSSTTPAELEQAQSLIFKGKEYATSGDPKMTRIVQFLKERGYESPESQKIRRDWIAKKQSVQSTTTPPTTTSYKSGQAGEDPLSQELTQRAPAPKSVYYDTQPSTQETGVLTVSDPNQASALKKRGVVYYTPTSKSPSQSLTEGDFVSNIPQKSRKVPTRELYEYNLKNVLVGQETYKQYTGQVSAFNKDPKSFEGKPGVVKTQTTQGTQYELTPKYFEGAIDYKGIQSSALTEAKAQFYTLPKATRNKMNVLGVGQGVISSAIGIAEFGGTLALGQTTQTFKPGDLSSETGKVKFGIGGKRSFKFGGALGEIRSYPSLETTTTFLESPKSYIVQKIKSPAVIGGGLVAVPLVAQGVRGFATNIKSQGWSMGLKETASGLSPLKIRPGIYAQQITKDTTFKNVRSYKTTTEGVTTRVYYGSSGSVKLSGMEKSAIIGGRSVGGGYSVTRTPFLQIRGGGTVVNQGVRTITSPYVFSGSGSGIAYGGTGNQYFTQMIGTARKGGISNVVYSRGVTAYKYNTGGGFYQYNNPTKLYGVTSGGGTQDITKNVKYFTSGQAKPIYETKGSIGTKYKPGGEWVFNDKQLTYELLSNTGTKVYQPSSRYRFLPRVSGMEFNLNKIVGGGSGSVKTSTYGFKGGGSSGKGMKGFSSGANVNIAPPVKYATLTKTISAPVISAPVVTTNQPSIYAGLGLYEKTAGGFVGGSFMELQKTSPQFLQYPPSQTFQRFAPSPILKQAPPILKQAPSPILKFAPSPIMKPAQPTSLILAPSPIIKPAQPQQELMLNKPQKLLYKQPQKLVKRVKLKYPQTTFAGFTGYGFGGGGYTPSVVTPMPPLPPFIAGGGLGLGMGNIGIGQSPARYTPSFKALFFKIRGKKPTGIKTGIGFRPITKGFSYQRIRKIRRLKI